MNWKCTTPTLSLFVFGALIALAGCGQKSDSTFDWQKAKWQARFSNGVTLSFSDRGIAWETNSAGPALIYRPLHLQPNRFYMASVSMTYDIRDYFPGGLCIGRDWQTRIRRVLESVGQALDRHRSVLFCQVYRPTGPAWCEGHLSSNCGQPNRGLRRIPVLHLLQRFNFFVGWHG